MNTGVDSTETIRSHDVLYLDFDGVLHPHPVVRNPKHGIHLPLHPEHFLFEYAPMLIDALRPYPRVKIVLSTNWVAILGFKNARKRLPAELAARCIGATYHARHHRAEWEQARRDLRSGPQRGRQVTADVGRRRPDRWLAIDDDDEGWSSSATSHLVLTDSDRGLGCPSSRADLIEKLRGFA
jgi:hypothetical protein